MKCEICGEGFNPESLSEVLIHEHVEGLSCDCGLAGEATGKKYTAAESVNVAEISFCAKRTEFDVEYQNGKRYRYFDFPHDLFKRAFAAVAIGAFLSHEVKGNYRYACINGD